MAKAKSSRRLREFLVAPGVKRCEHKAAWSLEGTRDALIASGLVQAEWFPTGKRGARPFADGWVLRGRRDGFRVIFYKPSSQHNAERGEQAEQPNYEAEREQRQRDIAALKRRLPPIVGNLSEAELEHLRVLRALNDETWKLMLMTAENLLLSNATTGQLAQPLRVAHLALVVDNDRQR